MSTKIESLTINGKELTLQKKNSELIRDLSNLSGSDSFEITMPKTGEFWIGLGINSGGYLRVWNKSYTNGVDYQCFSYANNDFIRMQYPCNKGDVLEVSYSNAYSRSDARFLILY